MAEYIVSGPSSREALKSKGQEVITRCKDCKYLSYWDGFRCMRLFNAENEWIGTKPENFCCWGTTWD